MDWLRLIPQSATPVGSHGVGFERISFVLTSEALGGGELFTARLAAAIAKSVPVRIVAATGSPVLAAAEQAGVETAELSLGRKLGLRTAIPNLLRFRAARRALDAFIEANPGDLFVFEYKWEELLWAGRYSRERVVLLEHGPIPPRLTQATWARNRVAKAFNRAAHVFAVSAPARDSIIALTGREPTMLQAGIDAAAADAAIGSRAESRASLGLTPDSQAIAYVGRVTLDKGIDEAIHAVARNPSFELLVCGAGAEVEPMKSLASELGVTDRVHWLGWRDDAYAVLAACDALVLLSTSQGEGRPLVVLEALSVGTTTVAYDASPALVALSEEAGGVQLVTAGDVPALDAALASAVEATRKLVRAQGWEESAASFLAEIEGSVRGAVGSDWREAIHKFGSVVVLSTADFDAPLWTNKQHVATRLASEVPVVYIESLALRRPRPTARDISRIWRRLASLLRPDHAPKSSGPRPPAGLTVASPAVVPFHEFRTIRWLNRRLLGVQLSRQLARLPGPVLLWTYSPLASEVFDLDDFDSVVFHCVDDLASNLGAPSKLIERLERDLATQADLVVASAPPLYERLSSYNPQTRHFHNVVDVGHFARPDGLLPEPPDLADVPPPRALFVGALSDHKIDWPLLAEVAKRRTEWAFVFVGPAGEESMQADIDAVTGLANVYLLGHRDYATLPSYMWAADAGLIPYRLSRHTESIFPMKTLEYAAAGIPIVSTPLPGVVAAQADGLKIEIAEDAEEFARGLGAPPESSNQSYVEKHTWDSLLTRIFAALPGREAPR